MIGTNHTRKGVKATETMEKIKNITEKLATMNQNKIHIVQTPPLANPINIREIIQNNILNTT